MKKNKITIIIEKPIDEVFEFTTNPKNTHLWVPFISEEITDEFPPRIGTIYRSCRENGKWSEMEVVEFLKNKIFMIANLDIELFVRYTYRSLDDNKTEMEYSDWIVGKEFDSPIAKDVLKSLKKVMEG